MKKFLKILDRYKIFLILAIALGVTSIFAPDIGANSLSNMWSSVKEMLGVMPPIFLLLGLLDVWVDRQTMIRYTGKGSGIKGLLISLLLGSCAAGPLYAAFPIAGIMLKKGSSLFNVFVFMGAWSTSKIPMLTFEGSSLGIPFMLARLGISIVGMIVVSALLEKILPEKDREEIYKLNENR